MGIEMPDSEQSPPASGLVVSRLGGRFADLFRRYKIWVDGREIATIARHETVKVPLPPGAHRLELRIDYARSPVVEVDVPAGSWVEVECRANSRAWAWPYWVTFGSRKYIAVWIRR